MNIFKSIANPTNTKLSKSDLEKLSKPLKDYKMNSSKPFLFFIQSLIILVFFGLWQSSQREIDREKLKNVLFEREVSLQKAHISDLENHNIQLSNGFLDSDGNPSNIVNIDTIKYSSYCQGFNDAIKSNNVPNTNAYKLGIHAQIENERLYSEYKKANYIEKDEKK